MRNKLVESWFALFAFSMLFAFTALFGQSTAPDGPINDEAAKAFFAKFSAWQLFLIPIVTVVVELMKRGITAIPAGALPWVAPFIGVALQYLGSKFGLWTANPGAGLLFGGLATWFNEAAFSKTVDQIAPEKPDAGTGTTKTEGQ